MRNTILKWCLILGALAGVPSALHAAGGQAGMEIESVGVRAGYAGQSETDTFRQAEAFAIWKLPWRWQLGGAWQLQTRLDVSAGWLRGNDADAFVATGGIGLLLDRERFPLALDLGCSPTVMSRDNFGGRDFGMPLQFTSHAGLAWNLGKHFSLGYRYQHMSNAHLSSHNPGLNLNMFSASYRF